MISLAVRIYGSVMFGVVGVGFVWHAIASEGTPLHQRIVIGLVATSLAAFGEIAIWAPSLLMGGKK